MSAPYDGAVELRWWYDSDLPIVSGYVTAPDEESAIVAARDDLRDRLGSIMVTATVSVVPVRKDVTQ